MKYEKFAPDRRQAPISLAEHLVASPTVGEAPRLSRNRRGPGTVTIRLTHEQLSLLREALADSIEENGA